MIFMASACEALMSFADIARTRPAACLVWNDSLDATGFPTKRGESVREPRRSRHKMGK